MDALLGRGRDAPCSPNCAPGSGSPARTTRPSACAASRPMRSTRPSTTTARSGRRTRTPCRAFCGTRRCASARPSPRISWRRSSTPGACWCSPSSRRSRMRGRPTLKPRGLRRLAVSVEILRRRSDPDRPQEAGGLFRLLSGPARPRRGGEHQAEERVAAHGQLGPGGLRRVSLRRLARHRQGAVRGRGRGGRQEGGRARIRRGAGGGERRPCRALGKGNRIPAHHHAGVSVPLGHAVQGAGHGRVHRGADFQLDLHRRAARQGSVRNGEPRPAQPLRRTAADAAARPTRCRTSWSRWRARASSTSSI